MRVFSKEIIWINNFCIHLYYLKVSWFMWMQRFVILTPTEHEFRNEATEELKRAARKYATKREWNTLLSCGLVHLQDQMFRRPAMGSSHDLSSFLLTGVRNCGWKMTPCWFCSHHFVYLKISTSGMTSPWLPLVNMFLLFSTDGAALRCPQVLCLLLWNFQLIPKQKNSSKQVETDNRHLL